MAHLKAILVFLVICSYCQADVEVPEHFNVDRLSYQRQVLTHVLFHEFGHAFIHEFQIPILANEETTADAFANYYIIKHRRDDAVDIITSRSLSWMIEDSEVSPAEYDMKGEHELDIRRAYQALCQAYGADPADWGSYFQWVGFSDNDLSSCADTSPKIESGWEQTTANYRVGRGGNSSQVTVIYGESEQAELVRSMGVLEQLQQEMMQFQWPEPIIIHFDHCPQGAYWSKSARKIMLCDAYVRRFIVQSEQLNLE